MATFTDAYLTASLPDMACMIKDNENYAVSDIKHPPYS